MKVLSNQKLEQTLWLKLQRKGVKALRCIYVSIQTPFIIILSHLVKNMKDWTEGTGHKGKSPTLYPTKYETWSQSPLWFWIRAEHRLLCIKTKLTLHQRCKHYSRCICVKVTEDKMQKNMKDIFLAWLPQYRTLQFSLSYFSRAKYDLVLWWTLMWRRPWCWSKSGMILFISLIIAVSLAAQMRTNLILWLVTLNVAELQDVSGHKWVSNQLVHKLIYYSYQSSSFLFIFYVFIFFSDLEQ